MTKKTAIILGVCILLAAFLGLSMRNIDFGNSTEVAQVEIEEKNEEIVKNIPSEKGYVVTKTDKPELVLKNQMDRSENNYYYAELNELINEEHCMSVYVTTNMPVDDIYYTVTNSAGETLYKGGAGLSWGSSGNGGYDIVINKIVFEGDVENQYKMNPKWVNETFTFYIQSGKDSSIKVVPNF